MFNIKFELLSGIYMQVFIEIRKRGGLSHFCPNHWKFKRRVYKRRFTWVSKVIFVEILIISDNLIASGISVKAGFQMFY